MQRSNPFGRAIHMMGLVAAAMAMSSEVQKQRALSAIGPYESRGKGKGLGNQRPAGANMAFRRAAAKKRRAAAHRARCR